jgi:cytochrome c556
MRHVVMFAAALAVAGSVAGAAQKATNPAELEAAMKRISASQAATAKAIKSGAFADARTSAGATKAALMDAENFWAMNKKADAVKLSQDALARVTALETALSAADVTAESALAAFKQIGGACTACHMEYRVQNEDKTYSLRPGAI